MSLFGDAIILNWLAFNKVEFNSRRFELVSPGSEYWRYVTPALIHFGLFTFCSTDFGFGSSVVASSWTRLYFYTQFISGRFHWR